MMTATAAPAAAAHPHVCRQCGTAYRAQRTTSRFCSTRCRVQAHRSHSGREDAPPTPNHTPPPAAPSGWLRWMDKRFYVARKPDGTGWRLYLPIHKLLVEFNRALRKAGQEEHTPASLAALLLEAGVDPDFPSRLPLGGRAEHWLDPMHRAKREVEAEARLAA